MAVRAMLLILGVFHLANGAFMLAAPHAWYMAVPGVVDTGPLNHHFLRISASRSSRAVQALRWVCWSGLGQP